MILLAIAVILAAYLIGSVNFAIIFARKINKIDIREHGSGNAGSTNAMRVGGKLTGTLTFICDFFKGTLSSFLGLKAFEYISSHADYSWSLPVYGAYICGIFCMLGHVYPVFFGFKGGKAVATGAGVFIPFAPVATVIGLLIFALVTILTGYVSIGSVTATVVTIASALVLSGCKGNIIPQVIMAVILGAIIILRHIENMQRIARGEEHNIHDKPKKEENVDV
ncbi:MAG: glycerol-3-phosphate 1-O-acyltransferase PlsY [Clostridia bacterium]|nr:glycerol-3-phosphate 1-O-acyltransferase PlsY [Clostridia bacterium]